ncbi:MAG TPA: hypothetical protein VIC08_12910, partial [Cellvibrionaceae bacterium]
HKALWAFGLCCWLGASALASEEMQVNYWSSPAGRVAYEVDLLQKALDAAPGEYPPYKLTIIDESVGTLRGRQQVADGAIMNIYAAPFRDDSYVRQGQILVVKQPLLQGILGYRHLIIRQSDYARFQQLDKDSLRQKRIGQGSNWPEVAIYRHNGFQVDDGGRFPLLLKMLAHGRVDVVPLGINEAARAINEAGLEQQLMILPEVLLYYPLPVVFQVSGKAPLLAQRLQAGMAVLADDGTLLSLFESYHRQLLMDLQKQSLRVLVLEHPSASSVMGLAKPQLLPLEQP